MQKSERAVWADSTLRHHQFVKKENTNMRKSTAFFRNALLLLVCIVVFMTVAIIVANNLN